jgi:hypothetical protein
VKTGFYRDLPHADYLAVERLSGGGLAALDESAAHLKIKVKETRPMIVGTATHIALFEPEKYSRYHVMPEGEGVKGVHSAAKKEFKAEEERGRIVLSHAEGGSIPSMVEAVLSDDEAMPLLEKGVAELSAFWRDETYGFLCGIRADWVTDNRIVCDLKTTEKPRPGPYEFGRVCYEKKRRYDLKAAWYLEGMNETARQAGMDIIHELFILIAVGKSPPHEVCCHYFEQEALFKATERIMDLKDLYYRCREDNVWPKKSWGLEPISSPSWM